jgi:hypothetical protein
MKKEDEQYAGWGEGWDYMLQDIWDRLDLIRADNIKGVHNKTNIDYCFYYIYRALVGEANIKIENADWLEQDKKHVSDMLYRIVELFSEAKTLSDKVIAIVVAEQYLRQTY